MKCYLLLPALLSIPELFFLRDVKHSPLNQSEAKVLALPRPHLLSGPNPKLSRRLRVCLSFPAGPGRGALCGLSLSSPRPTFAPRGRRFGGGGWAGGVEGPAGRGAERCHRVSRCPPRPPPGVERAARPASGDAGGLASPRAAPHRSGSAARAGAGAEPEPRGHQPRALAERRAMEPSHKDAETAAAADPRGTASSSGVVVQVREKKGPLRAAIPYMPFPVAVICLFLNTFVPGLASRGPSGAPRAQAEVTGQGAVGLHCPGGGEGEKAESPRRPSRAHWCLLAGGAGASNFKEPHHRPSEGDLCLSLHCAVWSPHGPPRQACVLCLLAEHRGGPHPDPHGHRHGGLDHEHLLGHGHGHPRQVQGTGHPPAAVSPWDLPGSPEQP
ncbi:PREDICTED: protein stum homolog isoform X2 [Chinchilla lanigera]|uniref:protein stum homolog isoform X2 n=1 Tax=Chinchilla lanigera TaxID=34839 RepID=UPI00038EC452|nr:PREDICTED: protein stum homolog isoform X2 [Chinchilla lanigera]